MPWQFGGRFVFLGPTFSPQLKPKMPEKPFPLLKQNNAWTLLIVFPSHGEESDIFPSFYLIVCGRGLNHSLSASNGSTPCGIPCLSKINFSTFI